MSHQVVSFYKVEWCHSYFIFALEGTSVILVSTLKNSFSLYRQTRTLKVVHKSENFFLESFSRKREGVKYYEAAQKPKAK